MNCTCEAEIPQGALFCPDCGRQLAPEAAAPADQANLVPPPKPQQAQPTQEPQTPTMPSLYHLKCPSCGADDLLVVGVKGSTGKAMATTLAFGAIGNLVAASDAKVNRTTQPIQYKCQGCKNKFESGPMVAGPDEFLATPANIHFERKSSFVGMAVPQIIYLNGLKIGPVSNGKALDFPTSLKYNTLFVTDQHNVAFRGSYKFEAPAGGNVHVRFNRKFI